MAAATLAIIAGGMDYMRSRWIIGGIGPNDPSSLVGHWFFVVDRQDTQIKPGRLVAFETDDRMSPWYAPGTIFIKQVVAMPGDRVTVDTRGVEVNGHLQKGTQLLPERLSKTLDDFARTEILGVREYWVLGTAPDSFDSRYWGPIHGSQVVGMATAVF